MKEMGNRKGVPAGPREIDDPGYWKAVEKDLAEEKKKSKPEDRG